DGTVGCGAGERALWGALVGVARLVAWNKRGLAPAAHGVPAEATVVETSATTGAGIAALRDALGAAVGDGVEEGRLVVGRRHREAFIEGAQALERAAAALTAGEPSELAAVDARAALHHLGLITGETVDAAILD